MLDTFKPTAPSRTPRRRPAHEQRPKPPLRYLEADFSKADGCVLYGGFSAEIAGVFIPTYASCPVGTDVGIRLIFRHGIIKSAAGTVEWTRELNPFAPETEPGLGIRLRQPDATLQEMLVQYAALHPPLFFENADLSTSTAQPPIPSETECGSLSGFAAPRNADAAPEFSSSFEGLLDSIAAYLSQSQTRPIAQPAHAPRAKQVVHPVSVQRAHLKPSPAEFDTVISAVAVNDLRASRQFHGGFSADDTGVKLFVATELLRPVGSRASLLILLPEGQIVEAVGTVRWVRKTNPTASTHLALPGLGIRLDPDSDTFHAALSIISGSDDVILCEEYFGSAPVSRNKNEVN